MSTSTAFSNTSSRPAAMPEGVGWTGTIVALDRVAYRVHRASRSVSLCAFDGQMLQSARINVPPSSDRTGTVMRPIAKPAFILRWRKHLGGVIQGGRPHGDRGRDRRHGFAEAIGELYRVLCRLGGFDQLHRKGVPVGLREISTSV
jgi:hypothetical protein